MFASLCHAMINEGFIQCDGLFLLHQDARIFDAKMCSLTDSLQIENIRIGADLRHIDLDARWFYLGESALYSWAAYIDNKVDLAHTRVQADYKNIAMAVSISSLPFMSVYVGWNTTDSALYANATLGKGSFELANFKWISASSLSVIPEIKGAWENEFILKRFAVGSKFYNNRVELGTTFFKTKPKKEDRYSYIFTDSSKIWELDFRYEYDTPKNNLSLFYILGFLDFNGFGYLREKSEDGDSEKRFFHLPTETALHFAKAEFSHKTGDSPKHKDAFLIRMMFGYLGIDFIHDKRRFYETLAPNRALSKSLLTTLSMSVYNRNFILYGDGLSYLATLGPGYRWDVPIKSWSLQPKISADFFYLYGEAGIQKQIVSTSIFGTMKAEQDSIEWNIHIVGALFNGELLLESPKKGFFFTAKASQVLPFYYKSHRYPEEYVVAENTDDFVIDKVSDKSDNISNVNKFFALLKNGFITSLQLGFSF